MQGIWRGVVGGWGGPCGRCLVAGEISTVIELGLQERTSYRRRGLSRS